MRRAINREPSSDRAGEKSSAHSVTTRSGLRSSKRVAHSKFSSKRHSDERDRLGVHSSTDDDEQTLGLQATQAPHLGQQNSSVMFPTHHASSSLGPFDSRNGPVAESKVRDDGDHSRGRSFVASAVQHTSNFWGSDAVPHAQDDDDESCNKPVAPVSNDSDVWRREVMGPKNPCSKGTTADSSFHSVKRLRKSKKSNAEIAADRRRQRSTQEEVKNITQPIPVEKLVVKSMVTTENSTREWKTLSEFYEELRQKIEGTSVSTSRCEYDDLKCSGKMSKMDLYQLVEKAATRPVPDVAIRYRHQLRDALSQLFELILVPALKNFQPEYSIRDLLDSWSDDQFCQGFAPQSATSYNNATRKFPCPQIKQIFLEGAPTDLGSNFLDLENRSGITFCNQAIDKVDLVKLIVDRGKCEPRNLARQEGLQPRYRNRELLLKEWVIMTKGPSASYFHVDAAGQATCIFGIQGSKTWCVPRGPWDVVCSEFQAGGTAYTKWSQGIRAVTVGEGTTIFQAPGTVHAVLTPGDCLVAGRFFYTAQLFAKSIKFMERFFQGTIHGNDDMKEADYLRLRLIVDEVHDETLFNPEQRREIWQATHELLRSLNWKPKVDATLKNSHGKRGKESPKVPPGSLENQQDIGELDEFGPPGDNYIKHLNRTMPNFGSAEKMGFGGARDLFISSLVSLWARFVKRYRG